MPNGIWDTMADTFHDVQDHCLAGDAFLAEFGHVDGFMDVYQDASYMLIAEIATEALDPGIREKARCSLQGLCVAEQFESLKEQLIHGGHNEMGEAQGSNRQAVSLSGYRRRRKP